MQEKIKIHLSEHYLSLAAHQPDATQPLYSELVKNISKINDLLISYHFSKRERIVDLEIDKSSIVITSEGKGNFLVNYTIGMFNACADLDYTQKEKMIIDIEINQKTNEAVLRGEFFPERDPDDL